MERTLDRKARRRIKRAIAGHPTHRVVELEKNRFYKYVVKHYPIHTEVYKVTKTGRLRRVTG